MPRPSGDSRRWNRPRKAWVSRSSPFACANQENWRQLSRPRSPTMPVQYSFRLQSLPHINGASSGLPRRSAGLRCIPTDPLSKRAGSCLTARTSPSNYEGRRSTWTRSSKAPSRRISPSSKPPNSSSSSTSRPPRPSVSRSRRRCWRRRIRSSSEVGPVPLPRGPRLVLDSLDHVDDVGHEMWPLVKPLQIRCPLTRFYQWQMNVHGYLGPNPAGDLWFFIGRQPSKRARRRDLQWFTSKEAQTLLAACHALKPRWYPFLLVRPPAAYAGVRRRPSTGQTSTGDVSASTYSALGPRTTAGSRTARTARIGG